MEEKRSQLMKNALNNSNIGGKDLTVYIAEDLIKSN
jgi:hypothetical protein